MPEGANQADDIFKAVMMDVGGGALVHLKS
jgi:hypothetical protein